MPKTLKKKRVHIQDTCHCDAYRFPHRLFGGECQGELEVVAVKSPSVDERLDDPRRGQAAYINRNNF